MITIENYKRAYQLGVSHRGKGLLTGFHTHVLSVAYDLGLEGVEIDFNDVVKCRRAGSMPESGISYNYRDQYSERGLSVLNVIGEKEVGSSIWYADRDEFIVEGIRLPYKGSDGETLILPLGIDQYDYD